MFDAIEECLREVAATMTITGMAVIFILPVQAQQRETPAPSGDTVTVSAKTMERLEQHLAELESAVSELKAEVKNIQVCGFGVDDGFRWAVAQHGRWTG